MHNNNGGEYVSKELRALLNLKGIIHEMTAPYSPHQNGSAERLNRMLIDKVRVMLIASELPKSFWQDAMHTATYLYNSTSHSKIEIITDHELCTKSIPNIDHHRKFGCKAYYYIEKPNAHRFYHTSKSGIFIDYC